MTITVTLSPETEAKLLETAARQGKDVSIVAAELLDKILEWEAQDREAIAGIQRGLDNFETGHFRSFEAFAQDKRHQYNLPTE